jgi:NhaP-type Na+/H+ or K+/H+ antiporter
VFGVHPALALLLGAILAPTDPVLAGSVTVGHAADHDPIRYALSGEAGLNDGAAFPFVVLGLLLLKVDAAPGELTTWALKSLVWAIPAGLAIGFGLGRAVGRAAIVLRFRSRDTAAPTDFLALALIALSYTAAEAVGALGFLAVFAAGIGLRRAEIHTVETTPHPDAGDPAVDAHPPAETMVSPNVVTEKEMSEPAVAAGVLVAEVFSFSDTVERIVEVLLVILVGVSLASHWNLQGVLLGIGLIVVIRPVVAFVFLTGTQLRFGQRALVGWFGIRGVGSLYYLAYAFSHGLHGEQARYLADLTLSAVATSILIHGISSQPLMQWYEHMKKVRVRRGETS